MKAHVNEDTCIRCGACTAIAEGIFESGDDGAVKCTVSEVPDDKKEEVTEAVESCPVGAISTEEK